MSFWRRIFGPRSKYDRRLPYTYEARVTVSGVDGMSENYQADTLCALLERLAAERVLPGEAELFEIRPHEEVPIAVADCLGPEGDWLQRPEACRVFEERFPGHERTGRCCYRDRDRRVDGPFVDYQPPPATGTPERP